MKKWTEEAFTEKYLELSRKLGKIPSKRDTTRFICSQDTIERLFGSMAELKEKMFEQFPDLLKLEAPVALNDLDIENYRLGLEKNKNKEKNKLITANVSTLKFLEQYAEKVFNGKVDPSVIKHTNKKTERILSLVLSDLHIGSDLDKDESGFAYGNIEESRRLAAVVKQAIDYKPQYREETALKLLLLGDLFQNSLHDPRDGAPVAEQVARMIHLLIQAIGHFAAKFKDVEVLCNPGNHGRNMARHKDRAIHQKWDSLETIAYYAIKSACKNLKNVKFNIPKTPFVTYDVFGQKIFATHGDTVLSPGNPGKDIKNGSLMSQINQINASLPDDEEYAAFIVGHVHTASITHLNNGTTMITNGMLVPPDSFSNAIGIMESNCGQWIFESVPGFAVGDQRFIKVGVEHDTDKSLDKIIKPFEGFNE